MADTSAPAEPTPTQHDEPEQRVDARVNIEMDIEALAEKVYRLMMAEIRLDRARGLASDNGG